MSFCLASQNIMILILSYFTRLKRVFHLVKKSSKPPMFEDVLFITKTFERIMSRHLHEKKKKKPINRVGGGCGGIMAVLFDSIK